MKDTTTKAVEYVKKALFILPEDNRDYGYFTKFLDAYDNAEKLADTDEKVAILYATAVKVAHQITSILFRLNKLPEDLLKEYREFPLPEDAEKEYIEVSKPRKEKAEELQKKLAETQDEQIEVDVFIQVVNGVSEEEARQKIEDYKLQSAAMQGR